MRRHNPINLNMGNIVTVWRTWFMWEEKVCIYNYKNSNRKKNMHSKLYEFGEKKSCVSNYGMIKIENMYLNLTILKTYYLIANKYVSTIL